MQRDLRALLMIKGVVFADVWVIEILEKKDFMLRKDHEYPTQTFCISDCSDFGNWCMEISELKEKAPVLRRQLFAGSTAPPEDAGRVSFHLWATS